jgi:hypothetical protein
LGVFLVALFFSALHSACTPLFVRRSLSFLLNAIRVLRILEKNTVEPTELALFETASRKKPLNKMFF